MDLDLVSLSLLAAVTVVGAVAQAAVGFGFSLLTLPFYLLLLEVRDAVQLAMLLSIAIIIAMLAKIHRQVPRRCAVNLAYGSLIGFPIGLVFFVHANASAVKAVVAAAILVAMAATAISARRAPLVENRAGAVIAGVFSGAMVTAIAMAGPAIAIYMQAIGAGKIKTRGAIFGVFFFSYPAAIALQGYVHGIGAQAVTATLWLLPAALLGAYGGHRWSGKISEKWFRRIIETLLIVVALYLFYAALAT